MVTFVVEFGLFSAMLLAATIPITVVARQRKMRRKPRRWRIGAVTLAFIVAVLSWSSRDLVRQCEDYNNRACIDIGGTGMKVLFLGSFIGWGLLSAWLLYND